MQPKLPSRGPATPVRTRDPSVGSGTRTRQPVALGPMAHSAALAPVAGPPYTTNLLNLRDARRFGNRLRSGLNPSIRLTTTLSVFFYRRSCQSYADNARNCARTPDPRSRWSQFRALLVHYPLLNFVGTVVSRSPPDRAMHRVLAFAFSLGCSIALAHLKRAAQSGVEARLALGA